MFLYWKKIKTPKKPFGSGKERPGVGEKTRERKGRGGKCRVRDMASGYRERRQGKIPGKVVA